MSHDRLSFLSNRGTDLMQYDATSAKTDLIPGNVGGQIVAIPFQRLNVSASLTGKVVPIMGGNTTNSELLIPRTGSVIGLAIQLSTVMGTGTADAWPTINGTTCPLLKCHLNAATAAIARQKAVEIAKSYNSTYIASQFQRVGLKVTTSSGFAPVTLDLNATVYIEI